MHSHLMILLQVEGHWRDKTPYAGMMTRRTHNYESIRNCVCMWWMNYAQTYACMHVLHGIGTYIHTIHMRIHAGMVRNFTKLSNVPDKASIELQVSIQLIHNWECCLLQKMAASASTNNHPLTIPIHGIHVPTDIHFRCAWKLCKQIACKHS